MVARPGSLELRGLHAMRVELLASFEVCANDHSGATNADPKALLVQGTLELHDRNPCRLSSLCPNLHVRAFLRHPDRWNPSRTWCLGRFEPIFAPNRFGQLVNNEVLLKTNWRKLSKQVQQDCLKPSKILAKSKPFVPTPAHACLRPSSIILRDIPGVPPTKRSQFRRLFVATS